MLFLYFYSNTKDTKCEIIQLIQTTHQTATLKTIIEKLKMGTNSPHGFISIQKTQIIIIRLILILI